jgi:hypothetical protein
LHQLAGRNLFRHRPIVPRQPKQPSSFQLDGILHGESRIEATDPDRAKIPGSFQSDYTRVSS